MNYYKLDKNNVLGFFFSHTQKKENVVAKLCSLCHIWIIQISQIVPRNNNLIQKLSIK